jgi:hypothetical protein
MGKVVASSALVRGSLTFEADSRTLAAAVLPLAPGAEGDCAIGGSGGGAAEGLPDACAGENAAEGSGGGAAEGRAGDAPGAVLGFAGAMETACAEVAGTGGGETEADDVAALGSGGGTEGEASTVTAFGNGGGTDMGLGATLLRASAKRSEGSAGLA